MGPQFDPGDIAAERPNLARQHVKARGRFLSGLNRP